MPDYGYNRGAFLAAAHLLGDSDTSYQQAAFSYVAGFTDTSPWHNKVSGCVPGWSEDGDANIVTVKRLQMTSVLFQAVHCTLTSVIPDSFQSANLVVMCDDLFLNN